MIGQLVALRRRQLHRNRKSAGEGASDFALNSPYLIEVGDDPFAWIDAGVC